jgi:MerR family transcriptional regulator, light-induced transcriptional regulator
MNHFTIKDIENLCGIKAHTLRIWEKRHQLVLPKRKQSKHRFYDNDDLKELLRISFLYHQGYKISAIAGLSSEELQNAVESIPRGEMNHEIFVHQLMEAGLDFDKERFEKIVNGLVLRIGLEKCISAVFYPFLQRIGLLWMTNHVIPAQEHFVSHIIRKKIICATDALETDNSNPSGIVVFAPTGEFHEIPLLVANYFLRKYNRQSVYFGVNVSTDCIKYYARHHPVHILFTHVITNLCNAGLEQYMNDLCKQFPDKAVILSGPAGNCIQRKPANLRRICSLEEMIAFSKAVYG